MSSILVLKQRDAVHLACDAAAYRPNGILTSNNVTKCIALPTLPAALSAVGPVENAMMFALNITQRFSSFDELVQFAPEYVPEVFEEISDQCRAGDSASIVYFIGWHARDDRPAAYAMNLWTDDSSRLEQVSANTPGAPQRNELVECPLAGTPMPGPELLAAAGFTVPRDLNAVSPEVELLHLMEVQRHEEVEGRHWVGGKCLLTSVDRAGVRQRVLQHWPEDKIGEPITPAPVDWTAWRTEQIRTRTPSSQPPEGMSRLKRDMAARREAKQLRRAMR